MTSFLSSVLRPHPANESEEGVTLIELLAVVVILAIIAAIAVPIVIGSITRSRQSVTQQNISILVEALNRYSTNHDGKYPPTTGTVAGLNVLVTPDNLNADQPYLKSVPNDGWGNPFIYDAPPSDNSFVIKTNVSQGSEEWWVNASMSQASNNSNPAY